MFRFLSRSDSQKVTSEKECPEVELTINQQRVSVPAGVSVWAAMAQSGQTTTRLSSVSEQPRAAYCAMGVCFECLVEIDGVPDRQACLTRVQDGMSVSRQSITETSMADLPEHCAVVASGQGDAS